MAETMNIDSDQTVNTDQSFKYGGAPIVFLQETSVFGRRRPERAEWLKHTELYGSLSNSIDSSHITGLQRVNGMWRIYVDNLEDKVALLNDGIMVRGKRLSLLSTNPNRLDSEQTIRVRIKNIPLSVEDGTLTRPLILKGLEVINCIREKLRYNGKLTNCETGDRLINVKATSLQEPLPRTMTFGKFIGRVIHIGQNSEPRTEKCKKCLEEGHVTANCSNDWKCLMCKKTGHKKGECSLLNERDSPSGTSIPEDKSTTQNEGGLTEGLTSSSAEVTRDQPVRETRTPRRSDKKKNKDVKKGQTLIKDFCSTAKETPETNPTKNKAKNRTPPTPDEEKNEKGSKKSRTNISDSSDSEQSEHSSSET